MKEDKLRKEVWDVIISFCKEDISAPTQETAIRELGFDSIAYLNLFVEIEQKYDIDIDDLFAESFQTYTVQQFVDAIIKTIG